MRALVEGDVRFVAPVVHRPIGRDVRSWFIRLGGAEKKRGIVRAAWLWGVGLACLALVFRGARLLMQKPQEMAAALSPPALGPGRAALTPAPSAHDVGVQVLARNIFDSSSGALAWEVVPPSEQSDDDLAEPDGQEGMQGAATPCVGDLRLLASIVRGAEPNLSMAALRKDGKAHYLMVGDQAGELELVAVHPTEALFRSGSGLCSLPVYLSQHTSAAPPAAVADVAPPAADPAADPAQARGRRPPAFSEEELQHNIRILGPGRYAVSRELFTRARANPSGISRGARFKPQLKDGRSSGMEVFKLRDDSLLAHLGVKQGDVLRGINGFSLGSADGVLEAFGHLGKKSEVSLSLERNGAVETIQYVLE